MDVQGISTNGHSSKLIPKEIRMNSIESFELIFEGLREDSQIARDRLSKVLSKQCIAQIFEIAGLLDGGPFLIRRSVNKKELESSYHQLKNAGAQVLLVKSRANVHQITRRRAALELVKPLPSPPHTRPQPMSFSDFYTNYAADISRILQAMNITEIESLALDFLSARDEKRRIFVFGNGGSALSASHMAHDFSRRGFANERYVLRITSLNENIPCMTATANEFGYEYVFVNQLKNALEPKDLVLGISSSGNSPNIVRAIRYANAKGAKTYGILGFNGGALQEFAQKSIYIPTKVGQYGYMEDVTLIINHVINEYFYELARNS